MSRPSLCEGILWATVYLHWLKTGQPMTRKQIAAEMGWKRWPRGIDPNSDPGLTISEVEITKFAKSYGWAVGYQMVDAWVPSRESLRERLRHVESDVIREALQREVAA